MTAFVDLPADRFDAGRDFWTAVTRSHLSPPRGDHGEFVTLIPEGGGAYLRAQRTVAGPRIHLDLHVESITEARGRAEELGASVDVDLGHVVMTSPTGLTFCFVGHHGEADRPSAVDVGAPNRLDQISIDIPASRFDEEVAFWRSLTGWDFHQSERAEFAVLTQPEPLPLRMLFQRLGEDDGGTTTRAHLDLACGNQVSKVRQGHEQFGAVFVAEGAVWTTMRDPAGMLYCLTQRHPTTGRLDS